MCCTAPIPFPLTGWWPMLVPDAASDLHIGEAHLAAMQHSIVLASEYVGKDTSLLVLQMTSKLACAVAPLPAGT